MVTRHMRLGRARTRLLLGATVAACALLASVTTMAQEQPPRHLEGNAAIGPDEVRARCIPTLIEPDQTCTVGAFGDVGTVAGHDFFYASYDVNDPSYPPTYPRIVIFEQTASAMFQPILISGDNWPYFYGKPQIVRSAGRILLHVPATNPVAATSIAKFSMSGRRTAGTTSTSRAGWTSCSTACPPGFAW